MPQVTILRNMQGTVIYREQHHYMLHKASDIITATFSTIKHRRSKNNIYVWQKLVFMVWYGTMDKIIDKNRQPLTHWGRDKMATNVFLYRNVWFDYNWNLFPRFHAINTPSDFAPSLRQVIMQVMLTAQSINLNQCWTLIDEVPLHSPHTVQERGML